MLKRSKKILLEGTLAEFKNYPRGAEGREYVLMNIEEKKPDGSYAFYEKDDKGDIIPVSYKGTEGYDATEFILFTDPEFERIILANFNTNPKGGITTKEADAITNIGQLFKGNTALVTTEDLALLKNVKTIPETAFLGCTNLLTAIIPEQIKNLENNCFDLCSNLKVVKIYGDAMLPGLSASFGLVNLDSIGFYGTKTTNIGIGNDVNARSVFLNNSIDTISPYTFLGFSNLTDINIPESVTVIRSDAFHGCTSLTSIMIPDSVTEIGERAFKGCTSLTSIEIPASVTKIEQEAFYFCSHLTSVKLPANLSSMGPNVFIYCTDLLNIIIDNDNPNYGSNGYILYSKTGGSIIAVANRNSMEIPEGVTTLNVGFESNLNSITFPTSLTNITIMGFTACSNLLSVTLKREQPIVPSMGISQIFAGVNLSTCVLYVPVNSLEAYLTSGWNVFLNIVGFDPEEETQE